MYSSQKFFWAGSGSVKSRISCKYLGKESLSSVKADEVFPTSSQDDNAGQCVPVFCWHFQSLQMSSKGRS